MAGPFALSGNQAQDVAPVRLSGGTTVVAPDSDPVNQAINNATEAVKTVGELNTKRLEQEAVTGVQEDVKSVRDALQITKHPNLAKTFFTAESLKDPYIAQVYEQFTQIQGAAKQGRMPQEFALERMEGLMSEAISRRPQFAESIRKTANETAGANISAKMFSQIFSSTPQQEANAKLQQEAARLGMPVDVLQGFLQQEFLMERQLASINYRKEIGKATANDVANTVRIGTTQVTRDVQAQILQTIAAGGEQNVEQQKSLVSNRFTILRNEILSNSGGVDGSVVNQHINTLDAEEERLIQQLEDGSMLKLMQDKRDLFEESAHSDFIEQGGDLARTYYVLGGGQAGLEAMNMIMRYQANPDAFAGLWQYEGAGALTMASMVSQLDAAAKVTNGTQQATTPQQKRLAGYVAGLRVKHDLNGDPAKTQTKPSDVIRLVDVIANQGEEYNTITLSDPQIVQNLKGFKEVHPQIINHYTSDVQGLQQSFNQLKGQGLIQTSDLRIENGKIVMDNRGRVALYGVGARAEANSSISTFLRRANATLNMGLRYTTAGVIPKSEFGSLESFLGTIQEPVQKPTSGGDGTQEVINVTINPDGSYNWGD